MKLVSWYDPTKDSIIIYAQDILTSEVSFIINHSLSGWTYKINQIKSNNGIANIIVVHPPQINNLTATVIDLNNVIKVTNISKVDDINSRLWETNGSQYGKPNDLITTIGGYEKVINDQSILKMDSYTQPLEMIVGNRYINNNGTWEYLDKNWVLDQLWIEQVVTNTIYNENAILTSINTDTDISTLSQNGLIWKVINIHHDFNNEGEILYTYPKITCPVNTSQAGSLIYNYRDIFGDSKLKVYLEILWFDIGDILLYTDSIELVTDGIVGIISNYVPNAKTCSLQLRASEIKSSDHVQLNIAWQQLQIGNFITSRTDTKIADKLKANCDLKLYGTIQIKVDFPYNKSLINYAYLWATPNSYCRLNGAGQIEWDGVISGGVNLLGEHTIDCKWSNKKRSIYLDNIEITSNSLMPIMTDNSICIGTDYSGNHSLNARVLHFNIF